MENEGTSRVTDIEQLVESSNKLYMCIWDLIYIWNLVHSGPCRIWEKYCIESGYAVLKDLKALIKKNPEDSDAYWLRIFVYEAFMLLYKYKDDRTKNKEYYEKAMVEFKEYKESWPNYKEVLAGIGRMKKLLLKKNEE